MPIKSSSPLLPSHPGSALAKDVQLAQNAAALVKAAAGKGAEALPPGALGAPVLTALAVFNGLAGLATGDEAAARQARQPQSQPQAQPRTSSAAQGQRGGGAPARGASRQRGPIAQQTSAGGNLEQGEDNGLGRAAGDILKRLRKGDQSGLEQNLSEQYDPLERYRLLQEALKQLDEEAQSDEDKTPPRKALHQLLGKLDKEHGPAIREGLEATGDMHALLQSLGEASVNAVRGWFGTPAQGKSHLPLTPIELAFKLRNTFGAEHFSDALTKLNQKTAKSLSVRSHRVAGEPPLMALADTRAFTTVRSCHAKARELMGKLAEINVSVFKRPGSKNPDESNVGEFELRGPVDLAITLMAMAGGGKEQAANLAGSIVDWDAVPSERWSRVWGILRNVVSELPQSLWPQDAGVKAAVLAEFSDKVRELDAMLPKAAVTMASQKEADLRRQVAARNATGGKAS